MSRGGTRIRLLGAAVALGAGVAALVIVIELLTGVFG
jgi:hypothetical protein